MPDQPDVPIVNTSNPSGEPGRRDPDRWTRPATPGRPVGSAAAKAGHGGLVGALRRDRGRSRKEENRVGLGARFCLEDLVDRRV